MTDKTFIKITNKMIYEKLEAVEGRLSRLTGKVLWHTWAIGVIVLLICGIITSFIH